MIIERKGKQRRVAFWMGLYFAICVLAQILPVVPVVNRIEPLVLGMPFLMFWYVGWVFLTFVGLVITYRWEYGKGSE